MLQKYVQRIRNMYDVVLVLHPLWDTHSTDAALSCLREKDVYCRAACARVTLAWDSRGGLLQQCQFLLRMMLSQTGYSSGFATP